MARGPKGRGGVVTEPDLPSTFVACAGCGTLTALHADTCPECEHPQPTAVPAIACAVCGDEDAGPWYWDETGRLVCEPCGEAA